MQRGNPWKIQRAPEVIDLMDIATRTLFSVLTVCCVQYVSKCLLFYFWILHRVHLAQCFWYYYPFRIDRTVSEHNCYFLSQNLKCCYFSYLAKNTGGPSKFRSWVPSLIYHDVLFVSHPFHRWMHSGASPHPWSFLWSLWQIPLNKDALHSIPHCFVTSYKFSEVWPVPHLSSCDTVVFWLSFLALFK